MEDAVLLSSPGCRTALPLSLPTDPRLPSGFPARCEEARSIRHLHCRVVHTISIMKNMEMSREGSKLIIEVDLTKDFGVSKSGKSKIIASSEGNISIPDDEEIKIGLNIYKKA